VLKDSLKKTFKILSSFSGVHTALVSVMEARPQQLRQLPLPLLSEGNGQVTL
jgi:hypothetical protein